MDASQIGFGFQSLEALEALFDGMPDGCLVLDKQWRIVFVNTTVANRLSVSKEALIGKDAVELFPEALNYRLFSSYPEQISIQECLVFTDYYAPENQWFEATVYPSQIGILIILRNLNAIRPVMPENSRQLFKMLPHHGTDIVCYTDQEGKFKYVSPAAFKLLGYRPFTLVGDDALNLVHPDDRLHIGAALHGSSLKGSDELQFTCRLRHTNVLYYWFEASVRRITGPENERGYNFISIWRNITRRKELEERLSITSRLGRIGCWERNSDNVYTYWSPEMFTIFGMESDTPPDINQFMEYVYPDDRDKVRAIIERANLQGLGYLYECEFRILPPGKDIRYLRVQSENLEKSGGEWVSIGVIQDVTESKGSEMEIKRMRDNLRLSQRMAGLGYFDYNLRTRKLVWSEELMNMIEVDEAKFAYTGNDFIQLVHPDDLERVQQEIDICLSGGPFDSHFRMITPQGRSIQIHSLGMLMLDERGEPLSMFGIVQNVSGQKQTEELLRLSEKLSAAGQLAAGIAHEIRNPLTALKGFTKLLLSAEGDSRARYYEIMQSEFERIELIVGELLMLAKPQTAQYKLNELGHIIEEVVELLITQANLSNVAILIELERDIPSLYCEANQLKQVFVNIIQNAIEAMPKGGLLKVRLYMESGQICADFIDEGVGIHTSQLPRIGQPFYTTKDKGTGLGMLVSMNIIQDHHGTIEYTSEQGIGTTVHVTFPVRHKI
ncbi:PAS domain S-box protein [Paenibacillus sp. GCM10012307]|uniref:histidine kinase n=1 Tax=Paenibacillus roseus TaxID=2798579 RepID=A0A934J3B4_9BACL|nr:PAS domain S-box protein [Paenibacillus roseus]MBJ6363991.1 PAS domain S-box protein [Paenibacillus roseus]